jgi:putative transcriptional regulator
MNEIDIGQILISEPFMEDPNFKQAVILICDYVLEHGTVGFMLNKPIDMKVDELIDDFPDFDDSVYLGGPVGHDTIHYVHKLKFLIDTKVITSEDIKFFVGYSGWSPGQLSDELKMGSWVVDDMDNNYLINISSDDLWKSSLTNMSSSMAIIAEIPDKVNLN